MQSLKQEGARARQRRLSDNDMDIEDEQPIEELDETKVVSKRLTCSHIGALQWEVIATLTFDELECNWLPLEAHATSAFTPLSPPIANLLATFYS